MNSKAFASCTKENTESGNSFSSSTSSSTNFKIYSVINTSSPNRPFESIAKHSVKLLVYPIPGISESKLNS